jgi:hypothetical protein
MEDSSVQGKLFQFLKGLNPVERTDLVGSAIAIKDGYSVQLIAGGKMLNISIGLKSHQYLDSTGEILEVSK